MDIELTVCGSSGSHTGPGRVCSGYLLRADGTNILVDAGNGSTANLQRFVTLHELDAVVVSHRHVDHCVDLIGSFYALRFDPTYGRQLPLYAAPEVHEALTSLLTRDTALLFDEVFVHHEVKPGDELDLGPFHFRFFDSIHPVPTVSMRIEVGGKTIAYSADSAGGPELVECARDVDLFLCDATWHGDADQHPPDIHLTARDAGRVATEAGAKRLVLAHVAGNLDPMVSVEQARETFDGPVEAALDLRSWVLD
jgi:ribonuclease BN (tRNA processing enzyme)